MRYYLSIEKNIEGFELYKTLWAACGIEGIRADSMTECITIATSAPDPEERAEALSNGADYFGEYCDSME